MKRVYLFAWIWIRMVIMIAAQRRTMIEILNYYREASDNYKIDSEFEWAFLTVPLGFVDDEYQQNYPLWAHFMNTFHEFISTSKAYDTRITKAYYEGNEETLCKAYLSDRFFESNRIRYEPPSLKNPFGFELKSVKFHYFSRITEFIKVIGCPVWIGRKRKESRLYFHEFHYTARHRHGIRGYFVFANINMKVNTPGLQHLELLMYSCRNMDRLPEMDNDYESEEAEFRDSRYRIIVNLPNIELYVEIPHSAKHNHKLLTDIKRRNVDYLHLFGEEAELFFLSKLYGFFNHQHPYWRKKELVSMLNRVEKGYELNKIAMEMIKKEDTKLTCENYIRYNDMLHEKRKISVREGVQSSEIRWTKKIVQFPMTQFLPNGRDYELLKCPVRHEDFDNVYILPIFYRAVVKPVKVFSFVDDEGKPGRVLPLLLSSVDTSKFDISNQIDLSDPLPDEWLDDPRSESQSTSYT